MASTCLATDRAARKRHEERNRTTRERAPIGPGAAGPGSEMVLPPLDWQALPGGDGRVAERNWPLDLRGTGPGGSYEVPVGLERLHVPMRVTEDAEFVLFSPQHEHGPVMDHVNTKLAG